MTLHYNKILNIVDSMDTFLEITNKPGNSLFLVKTNNGYVLFKGDKIIGSNLDDQVASKSKLGLIKASDFITVKKDGSIVINKANKLSKKIKLGNAYFDGSKSISLKEMGIMSKEEILLNFEDIRKKYNELNDVVTKLSERVNNLFQSVSNGKATIAEAITDKGIETSATDEFSIMATNISNIPSGTDTSDANATSNDLLSNKTAYVNGTKIIGNIPESTQLALKVDLSVTTSLAGVLQMRRDSTSRCLISNPSLRINDSNFRPYHIQKGIKMFGLTGTLESYEEYSYIIEASTHIDILEQPYVTPRAIIVIFVEDEYFSSLSEINEYATLCPSDCILMNDLITERNNILLNNITQSYFLHELLYINVSSYGINIFMGSGASSNVNGSLIMVLLGDQQ